MPSATAPPHIALVASNQTQLTARGSMKLFSAVLAVMALMAVVLSTLATSSHALPSNVTEIIRDYGYVPPPPPGTRMIGPTTKVCLTCPVQKCDDYWALTDDGYYLSLQRIYHTTPAQLC
jgi:hypothetical protein